MLLLFLFQFESEETKENDEASKSGLIDDEQGYPEGPLLMTTRM